MVLQRNDLSAFHAELQRSGKVGHVGMFQMCGHWVLQSVVFSISHISVLMKLVNHHVVTTNPIWSTRLYHHRGS